MSELPPEVWKPVVGYEGLYLVSNHSRVQSLDRWGRSRNNGRRLYRGKMLRHSFDSAGYPLVSLSGNGKPRRSKTIHRIVAEAFIPNPQCLPEVNHKDGVKSNCALDNLEWVTVSYNQKHAYDVLNRSRMFGERCGGHILKEHQVLEIKAALKKGVRQYTLADQYGVHFATISAIKRKVSWAHLP